MINYYLLTKPGIVFGNLVTVGAGFLLASKGGVDIWLFLATLLGITLIMASACVFNNYIDRHVDKHMIRTQNRPLVSGLISGKSAIIFASFLGITGVLTLLIYTNILTAVIAGFGFFIYVVLYSLWKKKTIYGTAIGSIAGATPPVIGYCAVTNQLDAGAFILFAMMVLWQMPHFYAIALLHFDDYTKAKMPLLPIVKGVFQTKIHMMLYIVGFLGTVCLLTVYGYIGYPALVMAMAVGLAWLVLSIQGFGQTNDQLWGRQMFRLSLVMIGVVCLVISV